MGTWGTGPFDSDLAADFVDELEGLTPQKVIDVLERALHRVTDSGARVDGGDGIEAVAAAAVVASTIPNSGQVLEEARARGLQARRLRGTRTRVRWLRTDEEFRPFEGRRGRLPVAERPGHPASCASFGTTLSVNWGRGGAWGRVGAGRGGSVRGGLPVLGWPRRPEDVPRCRGIVCRLHSRGGDAPRALLVVVSRGRGPALLRLAHRQGPGRALVGRGPGPDAGRGAGLGAVPRRLRPALSRGRRRIRQLAVRRLSFAPGAGGRHGTTREAGGPHRTDVREARGLSAQPQGRG
ncbi:DUF4259 domain-containing protein [Streptomyces sp. SID5464]|nr:DUF4259 domain-containing protein [Streptomyces sp. SID5464]